MQQHTLVESADQLASLLEPVLTGAVPRIGLDTESTLVRDKTFTPFGTDTRVAGISLSWPGTDLYVPVRQAPYDWRRRPRLLERDSANRGQHWLRALLEVERVEPFSEQAGWEPAWMDGADPNVSLAAVLELLSRALRVPSVQWYAHNWPVDAKLLVFEGLELPWERMPCTQALSVFTDERPLDAYLESEKRYVHGGHALKHLGEAHLGIAPDAQAELDQAREALGKGSAKLDEFNMIPLRSVLARYACMDSHLVMRLADVCEARPGYQDPRVRELLDRHMAERRIIVMDMERPGIPIDYQLAEERSKEKERELEQVRLRMDELAETMVPVEDPKRLAPFLYNDLGLPMAHSDSDDTREATLKKVRTKLVSRGVATESGLSVIKGAQLLDAILDYRKVQKELTAFYRPLAKHTQGRVHPVISPILARTTRAAASKPNVHQMKKPKKDKDAAKARANQVGSVRHLFKPPEGFVFLPCDFSSQEMRVSAHYSQAIPSSFAYRFTWRCTKPKRGSCKGKAPHMEAGHVGPDIMHVGWRDNYSTRPNVLRLVKGFMEEGVAFDPHQRMVELCEQHGLGIDRDQAKTAVYAILYGAGAKKLSETLDCSYDVARKLLRIFWDEAYPELGRVRQFVDERLRRTGPSTPWSGQAFIRSLHGGRIYLDSGYKGMNYLVQRSGREMLLKATLDVRQWFVDQKVDDAYRIMLPVHDELVMMVAKDSLDKAVVQGITERMVRAADPCTVPMVVEPNVCHESWAIKEPLPSDWGCDGVALLKEAA